MALLKCKICGGDIELTSDRTFGVCESCGSTITLPKIDDEQRAAAFNRGNHFRINGEFDKALSVYEHIVEENETDAEAHWCCALCRFGIDYVEDPTTFKYIPTCHRASFDSFLNDADYIAAVEYSDGLTKKQYLKDAAEIADVQRRILATSQNEEPFDVFICYKELDGNGNRTKDSVLAQDIYYQLTEQGKRVFFARVTLEDKAGTEYEPYIFAALNSAKVMVVVTTSAENVNAVWVKNEWSRFLSLMRKDRNRILLPCFKDMDPYDLPEQLSILQSYDMGKIGFIQDLIRGVNKITAVEKLKAAVKETVVVSGNTSVAPLLKRAFIFLEDGDWNSADEYCEKVLDQDPENVRAYLGKLMAELHIRKQEELKNCEQPFDGSNNYYKVMRYADEPLKELLKGYIDAIEERNENSRLQSIYEDALAKMDVTGTEEHYKEIAEQLTEISGYKDANELIKKCNENAEICRKDKIYDSAKSKMSSGRVVSFEEAITLLNTISDWKDADEQIHICQNKIEEIKVNAEKNAKKLKKILSITASAICVCIALFFAVTKVIIPNNKYNAAISLMSEGRYEEAITAFEELNGYRDSETQISNCVTGIKDDEYNVAVSLMNEGRYIEAITAFEELNGYKDSEEKANEVFKRYKAEELKNSKVGATVSFGAYEQDNNSSNGKEDIAWIVLDKQNGKALLISKNALDCQKYNTRSQSVTWETCTLRGWLNEDFINDAFSEAEQTMIQQTKVTADKNPKYKTSPGSDTEDKVFLLSINEVEKYFTTKDARECAPTAYAKAQGTYTSGEATCWWWLRSPGYSQYSAANVNYDGSVYYHGDDGGGNGVRPALWINLDS